MKYTVEKLKNNMYLAYNPIQGMESVALGIWVRTGSRYEEYNISGVSHYLEHLVFRGSGNFTANQIRESIEGVGGMLNAFTSQEYTCYFVRMRKKFLDTAFSILSDIVLLPNLALDDVEKERKIITEEIKMYLDIPMGYVHDMLDSLLWPNHPLGRMISGTAESVGAISVKDIKNYKQKHYIADNMAVVICGALDDSSKIKDLMGKYFSKANSGCATSFLESRIKQTKPQIKFYEKSTQQTHFALGARALYRDHPESATLSILNIIMGANMSSRLFDEVREKKGLAYEIGSRIMRYNDTGAFVVYAGIEHKNLLKAMNVISKELNRIKSEPPSEDEVNRAREYYKGQLLLGLEKTMDNMLWFGERLMTNSKIKNPKQLLEKAEEVTPDKVSKLANDILKLDNLNLSVIGPDLSKKHKELINILERI